MALRIDSLLASFDGTTNLATWIVQHITSATLFDFLGTEHRLIKSKITALLKENLPRSEFRDQIVKHLANESCAAELLKALSCTPLNKDPQIFNAVRQQVSSASATVREEA